MSAKAVTAETLVALDVLAGVADERHKAARAFADAQTAMEAAMVAARDAGASMARIGEAAGYSAPGVFDVLDRHGAR